MSIAFDVVFAVFVVAILVLAVVAIRWGLRRDRISRAQRLGEGSRPGVPGQAPVAPGPASDPSAT